jgi:hypothetical protein
MSCPVRGTFRLWNRRPTWFGSSTSSRLGCLDGPDLLLEISALKYREEREGRLPLRQGQSRCFSAISTSRATTVASSLCRCHRRLP